MVRISLILLLFVSGCAGEHNPYVMFIVEHRMNIHQKFRDPEKTPLTEDDLRSFKGLKFFAVDSNYRVVAVVERQPGNDTFTMPATGKIERDYVTYGIANFHANGSAQKLSIFQRVNSDDEFMFIPFTDETSGTMTYGGGRYLDIERPHGDTIIIDFNLAYNPYCAYNAKYSCPIPPAENRLAVAIRAGEKNFSKPD